MQFTFIPEPTNASQAAFQMRVIARGESLVADGYTLVHRDLIPGSYYVHTPEGKVYIVDTREEITFDQCQCGCYEKNHFCKHIIACAIEEERKLQEQQVADLEDYARRNGWTD